MHCSHNSSTTHLAMVTTKKPGDYQETRRLLKKEVMFTSRRLQKLDLDIMEAFIVEEVEAVESTYRAIQGGKRWVSVHA